MAQLLHKELSYKIVGLFYRTQDEIGSHCKERQYGDILEIFLKEEGINYRREFPIEIGERTSCFADFLIENKILVELKAKPFITKEDYYQIMKYLETANIELGLIVNFRQRYLKPRRVLNSKYNPEIISYH